MGLEAVFIWRECQKCHFPICSGQFLQVLGVEWVSSWLPVLLIGLWPMPSSEALRRLHFGVNLREILSSGSAALVSSVLVLIIQ